MRKLLFGCLFVVGLASTAMANGRPSGTSTIHFRKGMESYVFAGMTFGALVSKDSGTTWEWMCEDSIGYGGMYDPDYSITSTGAVFGTTFDGLKVMRDGCVFEPTPLALKFVSTATVGPDGAVFAAMTHSKQGADPGDAKIYRSNDDGATWPVSAEAGQVGDWWESLEVAPSDPLRLYLTGYRFVPGPSGNVRVQLLARSSNGGATWNALATTGIATMPNSTIAIVAIGKTNPDLVFLRVSLEDNAIVDGLYRSTDGGQSWAKVFSKTGPISVVLRGNGDLVVGTRSAGTFVLPATSQSWAEIAGAPRINCLVENSADEVWACTANFGSPQSPGDGFGIMKTADLVTWTGVLRYQTINKPVSCPSSTVQYQKCDRNPSFEIWCGLCAQLGCDPGRECTTASEAPPNDGIDATKKGCCQSGNEGAPGATLLAGVVGLIALRRRRRA